MNSNLKSKLLLNLAKNKKDKGFTLIELLVVIIIIGVLSAVALPNLLGQVGKARESEAKNGVGSINRGQQAYFTERSSFAEFTTSSLDAVRESLGVGIQTEFYDEISLATTNTTDDSDAEVLLGNSNRLNDGTRDYGGAIARDGGNQSFESITCRMTDAQETTPIVTGDVQNGGGTVGCTGNAEELPQ